MKPSILAQKLSHTGSNAGSSKNSDLRELSALIARLTNPLLCLLLLFIFKYGVGQIYSPAHYTSEKISANGEGR